MRILILSTYFKPDVASTGVLMSNLAEELQNLGHRVTVITNFPHYDSNRIWENYRGRIWLREKAGGVDILRLYLYVPRHKHRIYSRALNYASWNFFSSIAGTLAGKHDVIFVPSPPLTNGLAGFIISRIRRVPFVYNVQDIYPDVAIRLGILRSASAISAFKSLEKIVYSKARAVSVISDGFKLNLLSKGVLEGKLYVIPNFVDTEFIHPLSRQNKFSTAQGLDDRFVVLFAGNVGLSQGLERVLEAASLLRAHPDILFIMVGNGASKPSLLNLTDRLKLKNMRFLPFFPYQDVPEMYASSDVCLVPLKRGLTEESVPSKVFSILGAAKPVIASVDEGSDTWRFVQEADCGLCIQPEDPQALADAVMSLYNDRQTGIRMGSNGRKYVEENFSRQKIARQYEQLFMKVISGGA